MSYRTTEPETKAREFKSLEERDDYVERTYRFDRKGYASIPSYVAGERSRLVREFMTDYLPELGDSDAMVSLIGFEVEKFGAALEPVAHGMLAFAVRVTLKHGLLPERHAKVPARLEGEVPSKYMRRIALANGWISPEDPEPGRRMPEAPKETE